MSVEPTGAFKCMFFDKEGKLYEGEIFMSKEPIETTRCDYVYNGERCKRDTTKLISGEAGKVVPCALCGKDFCGEHSGLIRINFIFPASGDRVECEEGYKQSEKIKVCGDCQNAKGVREFREAIIGVMKKSKGGK